MKIWFEVKVKYLKRDEQSGKDKKVTEIFLVDAISVTDAEARFTEEFEKYCSGEFKIIGATEAKFADVFDDTACEFYWKLKIEMLDQDEKTGKVKRVQNNVVLPADTAQDALDLIIDKYQQLIVDWEVVSISKSTIQDIFD